MRILVEMSDAVPARRKNRTAVVSRAITICGLLVLAIAGLLRLGEIAGVDPDSARAIKEWSEIVLLLGGLGTLAAGIVWANEVKPGSVEKGFQWFALAGLLAVVGAGLDLLWESYPGAHAYVFGALAVLVAWGLLATGQRLFRRYFWCALAAITAFVAISWVAAAALLLVVALFEIATALRALARRNAAGDHRTEQGDTR